MDLLQLTTRLLPRGVTEAVHVNRAVRRAGYRLPLRHSLKSSVAFLEHLPTGLLAGPVVAVDVGANVGDWTAAMLHIPQSKVIAVEPTSESVRVLRERFAAEPRVTIAPVAAGSEISTLTLRLTSHPNFNSALPLGADLNVMYPGVKETGTEDVPVTTLDLLLAEVAEITLLKIDVQGFEPQVLAGVADVLRRTRCIMIECLFRSHYSGDALIWDLNPLLEEAGFHLFRLGTPYLGLAREFLWADAIYVPTD